MKYTVHKGTSQINRKGQRVKASFGYSDYNYGSIVEFSNVWMRRCFQSRFVKTFTNRATRRQMKQQVFAE